MLLRTPGNHFKVCDVVVVALCAVFCVLYQAGKSFLLIFMLTEVITVSKLAFVPLVSFFFHFPATACCVMKSVQNDINKKGANNLTSRTNICHSEIKMEPLNEKLIQIVCRLNSYKLFFISEGTRGKRLRCKEMIIC